MKSVRFAESVWKVLAVVCGLLTVLLLAGMPADSDYQWADYHGWGTGGLNYFSTSDNLSNTQALNLVNLLFEGSHTRARKGVTKINSTSLGGYGINTTFLYDKPSEFSQIIAAYDGKVYYCDPDSDDFSDYITDRTFTVSVTNNDSIVKGSGTFFTLMGYSDSIEILINDTTHYIYEILTDTMLCLYSQWKGGNGAAATLTQPFYVDAVLPVGMEVWLNDLFVVGTEKIGQWDGATMTGILGDTTSFKITALEVFTGCQLKVTVTPTFASEDYGFGDLVGYYIYSYNDTTTDTAQGVGNHPVFNKPLKIELQASNYIYVWADSFWVADQANEEWRHLDTNTLFKIMAPPTAEKLVFAGTWDSLHAVGDGTIDTCGGYHCHQWINAYDSSQTWDKHALDFGIYELRLAGSSLFPSMSNVFLRADGNGVVYLYGFYKGCTGWTQGDSFEIYRLYSTSIPEVPQYIAHWMDCQWQAGFTDDPNLIIWSEAFDPDSFHVLNHTYVDRDDGDIITALVVMSFQDYLLVFKKKHISAITVSDGDDILGSMWVNDLVDGIGTPSWASIVSYGRNVYFYDYSGWYVLNGIEPVKISWAIEDIAVDSVNRDYAHLIVGGYFDKHLWWSYPSGSSTKNNRTVLFNLETKMWTKTDLNLASIYVGLDENAENGVLLGSPDSGVVWTYGGTYFDDGTSITASYLSGWLGMDDGYELNKEFKDFQLLLDKHDSTQIYIEMFKDYSSTAFTKDTIGVDDYDVLKYRKRTIEDDNLGQRIQVRMTITRIDGNFQLPFFKIKWKPIDEVLYDMD